MTWTLNSVDFEKTLRCSTQVGPLVWIITDKKMLNSDVGLHVLQNTNKKSVRFKLSVPPKNITGGGNRVSMLRVYDASGREIRRFDAIALEQSPIIDWDMTDNSGQKVTNTIYFVSARINGFEISQKFLIMQ